MEFTKHNPLRVFEAFAGYGSQSLALQRLKEHYPEFDYIPIGFSEIDTPAITAYHALHGGGIKNYGDISKIDWNEVPDFDLFTMSSPCFVAGTLVLTSEGYKPIEEVKVGDLVLTKSNTFHVVKEFFDNGIHPTCIIRGTAFDEIRCTPSHKFWAREKYFYGHKQVRMFKEPTFVEAKDLTKNHYLGYPVNQDAIPFITEDLDFWYMIGMFIGDGWLPKNKSDNDVIIACNEVKEAKLRKHLSHDKWKYTVQKGKTCNRFRFSNKKINKIIWEHFGTGSKGKRIPYDVVRMPLPQLEAFLNGYIDSDGSRPYKNYIQFSTVNENIACMIQHVIAKVYHRVTRMSKVNVPPTKIIEGRVVNQSPFFLLRAKIIDSKQDQAFYEDGYIWYPFQRMEESIPACVYNIEVDEDHSYIVKGAMVKNCQDFSSAGKQAGGEEGSGTRSSLLWECSRAIEIKRPKYILFENVAALVSQKFIKGFNKWQMRLEGFGYSNFSKLMNSKDYGVPQNRLRIFMVSILRTGENRSPKFVFPNPFPLELRLKDVLEEKVDEKYYLSDERLKEFMPNESGGGKINSSQDGVVVNKDGLSPCHTAGHGNCPKVVEK